MKRTVLAAILSTVSVATFATNNSPLPPQANAASAASANAGASATGVGVGISSNHNSVNGYTSGYAVGNANSAYGVGGNATAVSGQGGAGFGTALSAPTQTVNIGGTPAQQTITHNGRSSVENVPSVYAPNIYPTAPCMGSSSVGAGWVGFGMSGGSSWVDTECQLQEAARNAPTPADRVFVWCKTEAARGAPSCAGLQPEPTSTTSSVPTDRDRRADATVRTGGGAPGADVWSGR